MTFEAFWGRLAGVRPELQDPVRRVMMGTVQFKRQLERAYKAGVYDERDKQDDAIAKENMRSAPDAVEKLRGMFGQGKW
jgi:hypothetical protein